MDLESVVKQWKRLSMIDKANQRALSTVHVIIDKRIFKQGKASDLKLISSKGYSDGYLKHRKRKGYPASRKVILQATNQMNNDFKFLVLPGNEYGSGFSNNANFNKSHWVEDTYKKDIFEIAKAEDKKLSVLLEKELQKVLNKL